ncbi:MAG: hypothetical protein JW791_02790 [Nanoarchaeota archaeon]|nr:hypothetical protein [Nanoarchaeota archaeon]
MAEEGTFFIINLDEKEEIEEGSYAIITKLDEVGEVGEERIIPYEEIKQYKTKARAIQELKKKYKLYFSPTIQSNKIGENSIANIGYNTYHNKRIILPYDSFKKYKTRLEAEKKLSEKFKKNVQITEGTPLLQDTEAYIVKFGKKGFKYSKVLKYKDLKKYRTLDYAVYALRKKYNSTPEFNSKIPTRELQGEIHKSYINKLKYIKKRFGIKNAYYPGCGIDITPAAVFDETLLLDIGHTQLIIPSDLKKKCKLVYGNAEVYEVGKNYDLMIFRRFQGRVEYTIDRFKGKYILTDNDFNHAFYIRDYRKEFKFVGIVEEDRMVKETTLHESLYLFERVDFNFIEMVVNAIKKLI